MNTEQTNGIAPDVSDVEALRAMLAEAHAKIERMKIQSQRKLTLKVTVPTKRKDGTTSPGGALSVYGMGKFPVTLYRGQWERLLGAADEIRQFIADNADLLSVKD